MRRLSVVVAGVVLLAVPGAARGATAFPIGTGYAPNVAVDPAGTAYIAWNGGESAIATTIGFCRLPRGASACQVATTITDPDPTRTSLTRPFVYVDGTTVRIVQFRYTFSNPGLGVIQFTSTDGGATFGAPRKIGTEQFDDAILGPGLTMTGISRAKTGGTFVQNVPLGDTATASTTSVNLSSDRPYGGALGLNGSTPVAVYANGSGVTQVRRYDGTGSINDVANWTAPLEIGYTDYPSMGSGPLGLFMLAGTESNALTARRFDGTTFGPPVQVLPSGDDAQSFLTEDPSGRLHAVIPQGAADGLHLVHATSDDGAAWRSGTVVVQTDGGIGDTRAAVAADHVGVAVWWTGTANGKVVRVAAIGPEAPVDPQVGGGGSNSPPPVGGSNPPAKRRAAGLPSAKHPPAVAKRLANGDVRVAIKGVIRRPAGVSKASGCRGKVGVRIKRGKRAIGSKTFKVSKACAFRSTLRLKRTRVLAARRLAMILAFKGNSAVAAAKKTYKLPIKGRR